MATNTVTENKASFTPGPWTARESAMNQAVWFVHAEISPVHWVRIAEMSDEANARLIAAAPELLAALKDCVALMDWDGYSAELTACEAAIARAEGRTS